MSFEQVSKNLPALETGLLFFPETKIYPRFAVLGVNSV